MSNLKINTSHETKQKKLWSNEQTTSETLIYCGCLLHLQG